MKLASLFILITCMCAAGTVHGQSETWVNLQTDSMPLINVLKLMETKSSYRFVFRHDQLPADKRVTLHVKNVLPEDALRLILKNTGLTFRRLSASLIAIIPDDRTTAGHQVHGRITACSGVPIPGVNIRVAGTKTGAVSAADGSFSLHAPDHAILVCTAVGYEEYRQPATGNGQIVMKEDTRGLQEVVVVAYGAQTRSSLTGSASIVNTQLYDKAPRSSFQESLQGNVPGVQSVNGSGQPGTPPGIRIRGIGSMNAGSAPLYVIDDVPVVTDDLTDYHVNTLAGINTADIASVSVLKDAAAASIYGSRAANGVVVITTRKGQAGKTKINLSLQQGINQLTIPRSSYPLNTREMMTLLREGWAHKADGSGEAGFQQEIRARGIDTTVNTDWVEALARHGSYTQAGLSAAGGNDKTKFYVSGGYYDSKAALKGVDYKRITGRLNLSNQATARLSFDVNLSLSYQQANAVGDVGLLANPVRSLVRMQPWLRIYNPDGSYDFSYNNTFNPVAVLNGTSRTGTIYGLLGGAGAKYRFSDALSLETKISLDLNYARSELFNPPGFGDGLHPNGSAGINNNLWNNWVSTTILRYNKTIGDHGLHAFAGYEAQKTTNTGNTAEASNFLPDLQQLGDAAKPDRVSSVASANTLTGILLNTSYDYKQTYYLTATIRRDGSSRFGRERKSANFWSLGVAWNIYKEEFLRTIPGINELKLRASFGSNGNQAIENYASLSLYSPANNYEGKPGYVLSQYPNSYLTWEQNKPFNLGLDFAFFGNRLSGTVEYYIRNTSRLLLNVPVSSTNGITTIFRNDGAMKNRGWEIALSSRNVMATKDRNFSWRTDLNISTLKNRITHLDNPITGLYKREEGVDFYQFYLTGFAGVDAQTGEALWYKDASKTATTKVYGEAQRFYQGSALPKVYGGITNYFHYRRFELSFQFFFNWGNKIYDNWGTFTESDGSGGFGATYKMSRLTYTQRWQQPGDITMVPKVVYGGTQTGLSNQSSSRFLYDGSFIRLRDLMVAYHLPAAWLKKANIQDVRIYVRANNLWTYVSDKRLTMDPEVPITGDYDQRPPVFKTCLAGLDINF
ncbi:SusC/RagA family TonB-linked outer membrane protein [Chitinophaga nivalis]|uniref:SusC/RagA family TonB-linked outer membrane protein n=1 Tax=Chitinophaga nivalis TaxID=2991709 RepID=A0ABT3ILS7_9BACT|nr:SusC/RagA family TonB-linked outer membrane protein [Chitinophaga nivalis]MCW3465589.1 SusC/RagA family TonB-linked outer membrane protein [Chitinophaga nivalis]MCW3484720.1 SusC/RagA family TonB-linked outer membrane protein [Chitinophaga nivalis]